MRRANAAFKRGIKALEPSRLTYLFLTHLHSDHTAGLPDLILTPWVLGRDKPLEVYGPPGTKRMVNLILEAYQEDIHVRLEGLQPGNSTGWKVNVHEIGPGHIYQDLHLKVKAFPAKHGAWKHAYGFRFETKDEIVVISGDTAPTEALIKNAKGCDILVHEVYSTAWFKRRKPEWQKYHAQSHTSSTELARMALRIRPKILILTHELHAGVSEKELLAEIRAIYPGRVVYGRDLDVF